MLNLFKKKKQDTIYAPCSGEVIPITTVNDPVFSQKMLGNGFAIVPTLTDKTICAPIAGKITSIFPSKHAINIKNDTGIDYLIHIGLDTVELKGKPFSILVEENETVTPEKLLVKVAFDQIIQAKKDPSVIVVFTQDSQINELSLTTGSVLCGEACGKINRTK
ncbi:PTS sugar transporter subunit IIA [Enterococcus ratti]|uniref:PTS system transporter subunit IIA n=1 Tax=Enterococcus ratti TaxID=150033 RepID=A0A1L8WG55_9ENTE|nr:PTS glucose transporter subunit IIA [Enterococcus ratti]OJG80013.1 PTS system transporter subunit IIA [Enterococcus ratti]